MSWQDRIERARQAAEELLEVHETRRSVSEIRERYAGKLAEFAEVELGFRAYPKQIELFESYLANKRTVVRGCHGAGKDAALAVLILYAAYVEGKKVLALSATQHQMAGQLWAEITNRWSTRLPGELYTADLRIEGRKRVFGMTAGSGNVSALHGWHDASGIFVAISESQAENVGDAAFDAAEGNTSGENCRIVVVGNPIMMGNRFHAIHQKPSWAKIKIDAHSHPNVIQQREVIPGGIAPSWPDEMASEYGRTSPFYVSRVLAEFPVGGSIDALFRPQWIDDAVERWRAPEDRSARERRYVSAPVLALDPARSETGDDSVLSLVRGNRVEEIKTWRGEPTWRSAEIIIEFGKKVQEFDLYKREPLCWVEINGLGWGVYDSLGEKRYPCAKYDAAGYVVQKARFHNPRAEIYFHARELLQKGLAALPDDPKLREELLAIEWFVNPTSGLNQILDKETLRKKLKRSTDRADSVVIALAASSGIIGRPMVTFIGQVLV